MTGDEIRQRFLDFFADRGHRVVPQLFAGSRQRPDPAVHQRRHEPVQGRLSGAREARLHARRQLAEVRARGRQAQRSGERRLHAAAPHFLRDAGQFFLRRLLQGGSHRVRLGPDHQGLRPAQGQALRHRVPRGRRRRRSVAEGGRRSQGAAFSGSTRRTTSGRWARPGRAGRARRSTTTWAWKRPSRGARTSSFPATPAAGSSKSGTWCSCSSTATPAAC